MDIDSITGVGKTKTNDNTIMAGANSALFTANGTINDDCLNQASSHITSCTPNGMINDDNLNQPSDDSNSSSEDPFTFPKKRMQDLNVVKEPT